MTAERDPLTPSIMGAANIHGTDKYRITLTCGHQMIVDHNRDPFSLATTFECRICGTVNRNTN